MFWVHPEFCIDNDDDLDNVIVYSCFQCQCRNVFSRLVKVEKQIERLHGLNKNCWKPVNRDVPTLAITIITITKFIYGRTGKHTNTSQWLLIPTEKGIGIC